MSAAAKNVTSKAKTTLMGIPSKYNKTKTSVMKKMAEEKEKFVSGERWEQVQSIFEKAEQG